MVRAANLLSSDPSTTSRLLELLEKERRVANRHALLYALTWHPDLGLWSLMVQILSDTQEAPLVRGQAAEFLAYNFASLRTDSRDFETGVHALLHALEDPSPEVRYCAVHALGSTGHPPLIPMIEKMFEDKTPVPGWMGTVADEASRAREWIDGMYSMRLKKGL